MFKIGYVHVTHLEIVFDQNGVYLLLSKTPSKVAIPTKLCFEAVFHEKSAQMCEQSELHKVQVRLILFGRSLGTLVKLFRAVRTKEGVGLKCDLEIGHWNGPNTSKVLNLDRFNCSLCDKQILYCSADLNPECE